MWRPLFRTTSARARFVATLLGLCALLLGSSMSLASSEALVRLARELTRLRAEVESISEQIADAKSSTQTKLRSLSGQQAELEAQVQREELRLRQLQQQKQKLLERVAQSQAAKAKIEPTILRSIAKVRARIKASLPFKQAERLEELAALEKQIQGKMLRPENAAARLWQFVEDELRLTQDSGLDQQVVTLDGQEVLCEVARLGMLAMYFKTQDGRVGRVVHRSGTWATEVLTDEASTTEVLALFDHFKKGLRTGFFRLPTPAPEMSQEGALR